MITDKILKKAYQKGLLKFIVDPIFEKGTVCKIGEYWFYFDIQAAHESPDTFLENSDMDKAFKDASIALDNFLDNEELHKKYRYFYTYLKKHNVIDKHWAEVRCDYLDEENEFWSVDAWEYPFDCDGDGKTIAYIDDLSGRVVYSDPLARIDTDAQEVIQAKVKEVQNS